MDKPRPLITPCDASGPFGADAAPATADVSRSTDPVPESSMIVYCGNERELREGFRIALRAMGVAADFLPADMMPSAVRRRLNQGE